MVKKQNKDLEKEIGKLTHYIIDMEMGYNEIRDKMRQIVDNDILWPSKKPSQPKIRAVAYCPECDNALTKEKDGLCCECGYNINKQELSEMAIKVFFTDVDETLTVFLKET